MNRVETTADAPNLVSAQSVRDAASMMGLTIDQATAANLIAYLTLIAKWNVVYNLTAIRNVDAMLTQHLYDSLAVLPPLLTYAGDAGLRVVDVGSGAGLPGVVVSIVAPSMHVLCVDAVGKKTSFVQQVKAELKLNNLTARHTRIERVTSQDFDVVASRAFSSLADFVGLTRGSIKPGGVWMAMKGKDPSPEIEALPPDIEVFHVEQLQVTGLQAERCIVWMKAK